MIKVGKDRIVVGESMKYLGIMLDSRLSFRNHFEYVENKVLKVSRALARLMPNLRGPGERKRRLYAMVVLSVVMYGASVWCEVFSKKKEARTVLNRVWRSILIRVIAAYRTVSLDASLLLARMPPLHLIAKARTYIYIYGDRQTAEDERGNSPNR